MFSAAAATSACAAFLGKEGESDEGEQADNGNRREWPGPGLSGFGIRGQDECKTSMASRRSWNAKERGPGPKSDSPPLDGPSRTVLEFLDASSRGAGIISSVGQVPCSPH